MLREEEYLLGFEDSAHSLGDDWDQRPQLVAIAAAYDLAQEPARVVAHSKGLAIVSLGFIIHYVLHCH